MKKILMVLSLAFTSTISAHAEMVDTTNTIGSWGNKAQLPQGQFVNAEKAMTVTFAGSRMTQQSPSGTVTMEVTVGDKQGSCLSLLRARDNAPAGMVCIAEHGILLGDTILQEFPTETSPRPPQRPDDHQAESILLDVQQKFAAQHGCESKAEVCHPHG